MDSINSIFDVILNNFDLGFCISVNILTYLIVKFIEDINPKKVISVLYKRIILIGCVILIAGFYFYYTEISKGIILNSSILAPVFWSWIMKPVCKKLGIDYNKEVVIKDDDN